MIPVARTKKLLVQSVGNELIVYDRINHDSHCLNPIAARVWQYCDGQHSVEDIAKLLEEELDISQTEAVDVRGLVWLTLEELERYQLIETYLKQPTETASISRRKVVKTGVLVGGFALGSLFPTIKSVALPGPGDSQSPPGKKDDEKEQPCKSPCCVDSIIIMKQNTFFCKRGTCPSEKKCQLNKSKDGNSANCTCVAK